MAGLGWCVQKTRWIDRERRAWREHDAKLAAAWRDDADDGVAVLDRGDGGVVVLDRAIGTDNVIVLPEAGSQRGAHSF